MNILVVPTPFIEKSIFPPELCSDPFLVNERSVCMCICFGLSWIPLVLPSLSCFNYFSFITGLIVELFPLGSSLSIPWLSLTLCRSVSLLESLADFQGISPWCCSWVVCEGSCTPGFSFEKEGLIQRSHQNNWMSISILGRLLNIFFFFFPFWTLCYRLCWYGPVILR